MSKNTNLHEAKNNRKDEFYTTKITVESELGHYWDHFKGKIVYCNCDDPYESEFFKYFAVRFNLLGLKGLYASCYEGSQMSQHQLQLFEDDEYKGIPYKIEIYQEDIDQLKEEHDGTLSQETIKLYIKKHKKAKRLKGNGSFDSPECLKLLEKADIVCTNEPFSLFRHFLSILVEYKKDFLIIGNMNAITYKEVFPLIKENKMWLGYTRPKEFIEPNGNIKKFGNITWFTNLDIPKRHDDLILWKKYSPDEYPHYDNYDAINVDKVAEIPCDYCESWGLYPEEFEALDKNQWEEVRREPKNDTELIYVIPAKNTELRQALHNHSEGYKEKIEAELANAIYCNGCMGVPITVLDKYNPEQLEIVKFRKGDDGKDLTYTTGVTHLSKQASKQADYTLLQNHCQKDTVVESLECQSPSSTNGIQNSSLSLETNIYSTLKKEEDTLKENVCIAESLLKRYCNGCVGVPITILDKYNPEQLEIINPLDVSIDKPQNEPIIANAGMQECRNAGMQECRNAGMQECRNAGMQECRYLHLEQTDGMSTANASMLESLSARYCNGIFGVPITFLDKWSAEQFILFGATESEGTGFSAGLWYSSSKITQPLIKNSRKYKRLFIQKIL